MMLRLLALLVLSTSGLPLEACDGAVHMLQTNARHAGKAGKEVRISSWMGRTGDNILQVGNAIVFAKWSGASRVVLPKTAKDVTLKDARESVAEEGIGALFDLPAHIDVPISRESMDGLNCSETAAVIEKLGEYEFLTSSCDGVPARMLHQVLSEHLVPYMTSDLQECVSKKATPEEESLLTIHLRTGDAHDMTWPCNVIPHLQSQYSYSSVLAVTTKLGTEREHWCTSYLNETVQNMQYQMESVTSDFCSLLRAKNLFVGSSAFAVTAAFLSPNAERLFHGGPKDEWIPWLHHQPKYCVDSNGSIWDGTDLTIYGDPDFTPRIFRYEAGEFAPSTWFWDPTKNSAIVGNWTAHNDLNDMKMNDMKPVSDELELMDVRC